MTQHLLKITTRIGIYKFLYDETSRCICLVCWPDGESAMRILAAGLPKTIQDATIAAENYIRYIENAYPIISAINAAI